MKFTTALSIIILLTALLIVLAGASEIHWAVTFGLSFSAFILFALCGAIILNSKQKKAHRENRHHEKGRVPKCSKHYQSNIRHF